MSSKKVWFITGAGRGMGADFAKAALAAGYAVVATGRNPESVSKTLGASNELFAVKLDVTSRADADAAVRAAVDRFGRIDVLVNNAGLVGSYDNIVDIALEDYHRIVAINQTGVFLGIRSVVPAMTEAGGGAIVNTSSIWGLVGAAGVSAYQASKGAVTVITRNAAASFAKAGIRCNSVHPGLIETPLTAPQDPAISQGLVDATPLGRAGTAAEVAAAITFLASTDASYITGAALVVDGGFTTV